jgi:hypothetical protein
MLFPSSELKCVGSGIGLIVLLSYKEGDHETQGEGARKGVQYGPWGSKDKKQPLCGVPQMGNEIVREEGPFQGSNVVFRRNSGIV